MNRLLATSQRWPHLLAALVIIAVLGALPYFLSSYHVFLAARVLIFAMFAMALNLVFGLGGLPSLGHAAFFGVGGYTVAIGLTRWGWGFWLVLAVAVALGLALGALLGLLTIRTEGIYLLLLTLAFAQSIWALAFEQVGFTQGDNGIAGISRETIPFLSDDYYTFVLGVCVLAVGAMWMWSRSPVGRALVGARESKSRMEALGYEVWRYRVAAFALSGGLSALAGLLLVYLQGIASPELLYWPLSAEVLVMCIIGGAGTLFGPALGALVVIGLQEFVSVFTERWTLVLGALYILTMLVMREGLAGFATRLGKVRGQSAAQAGQAGDEALPTPERPTGARL